GRHAVVVPEGLCEMALVGEARRKGDLGQRRTGLGELLASELNAQTAEIFARGTAVLAAESAGEVDGVDADGRSHLSQRQAFLKPVVQQLPGPDEPSWGRALWSGDARPECLGQNLQSQPLQCQGRGSVRP